MPDHALPIPASTDPIGLDHPAVGHDRSLRLRPAVAETHRRTGAPLWLVRPRDDGGNDFVSFQPSPGAAAGCVEMREGSHLPPQLPLLKRRRQLAAAEAEACGRHLLQEGGYRRSEPLF